MYAPPAVDPESGHIVFVGSVVWALGSAGQVKSRLDALARRLDLEELVIVTWTYDQAPRMRSYELLAEAYGLKK